MTLYLYRLFDFSFEDEDDEEYLYDHKKTRIIETKLDSVLPMAYGYFDISANAIAIYPYETTAWPSKPIVIHAGKEVNTRAPYSIVIPYQNKQMAKKIFSEWLEAQGYKLAAKAVSENPVGSLRRMKWPIMKEDVSFAKHWDKVKTEESHKHYCEVLAKKIKEQKE